MLVTVMGIEKVIPRLRDLEVLLQLLPRSSTGERMNPYTSLWTGVREGDGPQAFHSCCSTPGGRARSPTLSDAPALRCIRCSACINVCPVYRQTGGHAYHTLYAGPIGAILAPQLAGDAARRALPFASTLCGACYDVCPVAIDIPSLLVHERAKAVARERLGVEGRSLKAFGRASRRGRATSGRSGSRRSLQRPFARDGWIGAFHRARLRAWGRLARAAGGAAQTFREWWEHRERA